MNIVDWKTMDKRGELTGVKPKVANKERKQIFKTLLERTIDDKWMGKVCLKHGPYDKLKAPYVEIRKRLGDANVLMSIGVKVDTQWVPSTGEVVSLVSMNGTAQLSSDDFIEMNLAAAEARGMYEALIEKKNEKTSD